ncbi:MAG: c-type cytochrome [Bacillota bacterium]
MRMHRILVGVVAGVVALTLAACSGGGSKKEPGLGGDAANGKVLFVETCSSCHGPDGKGLPGLGKGLHESEFTNGLTDQELLDFMKVGRSTSDPLNTTGVEMPARGGNPALTDEKLIDIIAYIRTLRK